MRKSVAAAVGCVLLPCTAWAVAALYFDMRVPWLRLPLAGAYVAGLLALWFLVKHRCLKRPQAKGPELLGHPGVVPTV
jgi:hypothetical protein